MADETSPTVTDQTVWYMSRVDPADDWEPVQSIRCSSPEEAAAVCAALNAGVEIVVKDEPEPR